MTGPRTNALLEAIAAELRGHLPGLKSCRVHDGPFDDAEVSRWAAQTPAVRVAWIGTKSTGQPGVLWTDCSQRLAAYVLTRDAAGLSRGAASRNLVDWLLLHLPRTRWGIAALGAATAIKAQNLFSTSLDKSGLSLAVVEWTQELRLEAAADGTCPPLPEELYAAAQGDEHEAIEPGGSDGRI